MKVFEIWSEGFIATGDSGPATYHGTQVAETFRQACKLFFGEQNDANFNLDRLSYWGCGLFDNEKDARKAFG